MAVITKIVLSIKPGKMDEAHKLIDSQSRLASTIDGMIGFTVAATGDTELTVIDVYKSKQAAESAYFAAQDAMLKWHRLC